MTADKLSRILYICILELLFSHSFQIRAFHKFYSSLHSTQRTDHKLVLIGGCRNEDDQRRVDDLRELAAQLEISDCVEFCLNVPFSTLKQRMSESTIGIHTMWNEHFGIGMLILHSSPVLW